MADDRHTYATGQEWANYLHQEQPPADADRILRTASTAVDELLLTAVYDTDGQGMPTRAEHIRALRLATCAVATWWDDIGDPYGSGAPAQVQSASIAGVSLGFNRGKKPDRHGPDARRHLADVGLLGHGPYH